MKTTLFIFAGEKSGDLHGSHLIASLKSKIENVEIEGVAGPLMRQFSIKGPRLMEDFEVMGFTDVILALPKLITSFISIKNHILKTNPTAVILIDYPGFNLRMAKALKKSGYSGKIIQYVSPTIWAWGKERKKTMIDTLDLLLTIYPFEKNLFKQTSLKTFYIGNPLVDYLKSYSYNDDWKTSIGIPEDKPLVSIFPGSREKEIIRNLPVAIDAAKKILRNEPTLIFAVSSTSDACEKRLKEILKEAPSSIQKAFFTVPRKFSYELMKSSRSSIAKSGTVTLELALHKCPTVVIYKLTWINRLWAKYILKLNLPNYCIVNILAGKTIFPELIEKTLNGQTLYTAFQSIDQEGEKRSNILRECREIYNLLNNGQAASDNGALEIKEIVKEALKC